MGREEEVIKDRKKKIEEMKKKGLVPYSYNFDRRDFCGKLQEEYAKLLNEGQGRDVIIAGRIMTMRDLGKIAFLVLQDSTGKIQLVLQEGETGKEILEKYRKYVDSGDIIGIKGRIFRTKRGELSILVKNLEILTKAVKPIPDQFYGLQDKE